MIRLREHGNGWAITLNGRFVARGDWFEMHRLYVLLGGLRMAEF